MSDTKTPWFVVERSEALAGLLLTSRDDVHVLKEDRQDDGMDFLVSINTGKPLSTRFFVVQVKGTTSSNPDDWMENVKHLFSGPGRTSFLPVCVFVVNVRDNKSVYAWAAEPTVEPKGATLVFHRDADFHDLDSATVTEIVERIKAWYDVLSGQFVPA